PILRNIYFATAQLAPSITGRHSADVVGMNVRDQHEIDRCGGIAGAPKPGLQATERPAAPPLSGAGIHENDLLPSVHEKTRFGAVEEVRFFLHRACDGGHDFVLPVQPARLELSASVVE